MLEDFKSREWSRHFNGWARGLGGFGFRVEGDIQKQQTV